VPYAILTDGPLAGDVVPVALQPWRLPPDQLDVPVLHLDEDVEEVSWRSERYRRSPLLRVRRPEDPWEYHHA
jgi:hypothetical protein